MATDDPDGVLARHVAAAMDRVALSLLETRWRIEDYVKCETTWQEPTDPPLSGRGA